MTEIVDHQYSQKARAKDDDKKSQFIDNMKAQALTSFRQSLQQKSLRNHAKYLDSLNSESLKSEDRSFDG